MVLTPVRRELAASAALSLIMSAAMSAVMTLVNVGAGVDFPLIWAKSCLIGFGVSFPLTLVVVPPIARWQSAGRVRSGGSRS